MIASDEVMLLSLKDVPRVDAGADGLGVHRQVVGWMASYLMSPHPDLGRPGMVCPFTAHAARIDTVRIGVSQARGSDGVAIEANMRRWFKAFAAIPCDKAMRSFRTILVAFPNMTDAAAIETLHRVQARIKLHTLRHGLMTAVFHEDNDASGLWNEAFRPLRAPIPLVAIRQLVVNDAPFVASHPLLLPTYLRQFPIAGTRRLVEHAIKRWRRIRLKPSEPALGA